MINVLSARELEKSFSGFRALRGVNFAVPEGSIYALTGPNGAGKTTTIKTFMNLIQPSAGDCEVLGVNSRDLRSTDFTKIGYVSDTLTVPGWMTVGGFLAYLRPFYPNWDNSRASHMIRCFKVPVERKLRHLSRGDMMKTLLISSLAYAPRVLVLDEPFGGLDAVTRDDMIQGLLENAGQTSVLISSHDLSEIETFASHIGYLASGRIHISEEMATLISRFREIEVIVEPPASFPGPGSWPSNWLRPEVAPGVIRFVESAFDNEGTSREIRSRFAAIKHVSVSPMPLRSIFITITRGTEKAA